VSRRIALLGLSGVGKTTMLDSLKSRVEFTHLEASRLIKSEQARRSIAAQSSEALRNGPVLDNQALLIAGFDYETVSTTRPIVLDGHSVIDGSDGIVEIPAEVFAALRISAICVLQAKPSDILARRLGDRTRTRPMRTIEAISTHQARETSVAQAIAEQLGLPIELLCDSDESRLAAWIRVNHRIE
jgi:adenylate kinase